MTQSRLIAVSLDGYEYTLAESMMQSGELPCMRRVAGRSARFLLDHGSDLRTGLAGEHVATGMSAAAANRWAAVHFDSRSYDVWQQGTTLTPFPARFPFRTVVIDPPYFDLGCAPNVRGFVGWGAHDPGVPTLSRPANLLDQICDRFGSYPAQNWIYGTPWSSVDDSRRMGDSLVNAVSKRAEIAEWVLTERAPDWDLALITVSEAHSAIEGLWHGIDTAHPLHDVPSAKIAGAGVRNVYRAIDELIGRLIAACPDATVVVFSMHGMGANESDAASMFLLGELLYRHAFGEAMHNSVDSPLLSNGLPNLLPSKNWRNTVRAGFVGEMSIGHRFSRRLSTLLRQSTAKRTSFKRRSDSRSLVTSRLEWMPLTRYRPYWRAMSAFALPSFYDGRVRVNLVGRETEGKVNRADYRRVLDEISGILEACVDPLSKRSVVQQVARVGGPEPLDLGETQADLVVLWDNAPLALEHPDLGTIGPIPYRRTGGHTGRYGFAYFCGDGIDPSDRGIVSAYDIVPSIVDILGCGPDDSISGRSVFGREQSDSVSRAQPPCSTFRSKCDDDS